VLVLPTYRLTYRFKFSRALHKLVGEGPGHPGNQKPASPMEGHSTLDIAPLLYERFEVLEDFHFNAFAPGVLWRLKGPDAFRYAAARAVVALDRLLCRLGLCHGRFRVIIGKKKGVTCTLGDLHIDSAA